MTEVFKCFIEVPKHGIKKNSKEIKFNPVLRRRFIGSNRKAQYLENMLAAALLRERLKARIETFEFDVNAKIVFYFPKTVYFTKAGNRSNRVGDLSNLYQNVEDCLQKSKILLNDSQIVSHDGSGRKPIEGSKYMLEIILTRAES
jgi:Holliday junction resolvase RusA-like endonuclease